MGTVLGGASGETPTSTGNCTLDSLARSSNGVRTLRAEITASSASLRLSTTIGCYTTRTSK